MIPSFFNEEPFFRVPFYYFNSCSCRLQGTRTQWIRIDHPAVRSLPSWRKRWPVEVQMLHCFVQMRIPQMFVSQIFFSAFFSSKSSPKSFQQIRNYLLIHVIFLLSLHQNGYSCSQRTMRPWTVAGQADPFRITRMDPWDDRHPTMCWIIPTWRIVQTLLKTWRHSIRLLINWAERIFPSPGVERTCREETQSSYWKP